jgi:hypothetical protein
MECEKELDKCFEQESIMEINDFIIEKAINIKQWLFLAQKLLDEAHAKSVFYFFSPFLVQFCPVHHLQWFHIFYEECLHVKTVIKTWPVTKMEFMKCPSVEEYLSSGRKRVFGPVMSCPAHLNQDYNFCVQKHMNILPAKKNSSWKDACNNLKQVKMSSQVFIEQPFSLQMFENCQLILKNCQHPREFNSFVEDFRIDIRATIAAMEDVCPIAKHKSLKDCPVLSENKDHVSLITFPILVNEMEEVDFEVKRILKTKNNMEKEIKDYTNKEDKLSEVNSILSPSVQNAIRGENDEDRTVERKAGAKIDITPDQKRNTVIEILKKNNEMTTLFFSDSSNTFEYYESDPNNVIKEDNLEKDKKKSSINNLSKLFTVDKANDSLEVDTELISNKSENVGKVYNIRYNSNDSNNYTFEALNLHDEREIFEEEERYKKLFNPCNDNDNTCTITKLLLVLAIVSLVVLAIAFYWEFSQGLAKNYPNNGAFI